MSIDQMATSRGKPLHGMFSAVPPRYDLVNSVITFNMDKRWRRLTAKEILKGNPAKILNMCCGTGDLALTIATSAHYAPEIKGLDFSQPMLEIANKKASRLPGNKKVRFLQGDASRMPFEDEYFGCIGISFGFRNLIYKNPLAQAHLADIFRVLKTGGRFVIVESSQPESKLVRGFFHLYLRFFVYPAGSLLSGNKSAYRYLAESVVHFYNSTGLKDLLLKAGFREVDYKPLFFGASGIHIATK